MNAADSRWYPSWQARDNHGVWIARRCGSAEQPPTPEQIEQWHRRISPPDNEFPAGIGGTVLLGRSDDAAVGLTHIEAFSTGFRFTLAVRVRQMRPELAAGGLHMLISPIHPGIAIAIEDRLLLGIEYPGGHRASTLGDMRRYGPGAVPDGEQLMLVEQGGGGGHQSIDQTYWVTPLPPAGLVDIILAWTGFGIPECRTALDGTAIRAAASRSRILWPPQPSTEPPEPPPGPRPSSGWFAEP
jgi:hypothetical protein